MVRLLLALCLTACATGGESARFPSADEMRRLTELPPPTDLGVREERDVDGWTLVGPLASRIELAAHAAATPWEELLVPARPAFASEATACVAREAGRFYLANGALPGARLRAFMAGRCGSPVAEVVLAYNSGNVPAEAGEAAILGQWRPQIESWLQKQLARGRFDAGMWFGRAGGRAVVMLALQRVTARLQPLAFRPDGDGRVVLQGELLVPTANLQGLITRGRFGYAPCTVDPTIALPRFAVTCPTDAADETARIEVAAFAAGRITGPLVIDLSVWPAHEPDAAWRRPTLSLPAPPATDRSIPGAALGSIVNEVRYQASLPTLSIAAAQCRTAAAVASHYFAAVLGLEEPTIADRVVLGLRAGWDVEGSVRAGHFTAGAVASHDWNELVATLLDRPSGRETLLAPAAKTLAVGTVGEEDKWLAAVVSTYEFSDDKEVDAERVLQRLTELRRAAGRPAPQIIRELKGDAAELAQQVARGRSPRSAMQSLMETVAAANHGARGWAVEYLTVDALEFPSDLIQAPSLRLGVVVAPYKPRGEPWTRCVVILVTVEDVAA
jgi:hypothetical protein